MSPLILLGLASTFLQFLVLLDDKDRFPLQHTLPTLLCEHYSKLLVPPCHLLVAFREVYPVYYIESTYLKLT